MASGVRVAHKYFFDLVKNWKIGTNSELRLCSEDGKLKVNYSVDLGVWVPPKPPENRSSYASRGHQGTRRAGPSRTRRRERRAAARAAKVDGNTTENVEETRAEHVNNAVEANNEEVEKFPEKATSAEEVPPAPRKGRTCTKCGGPSKGHTGPCGRKCSMVLSTPEKERRSSLPEELSLTLTPGQEDRQEQCSNCCTVVLNDHQCEEYIAPEVLSPQKPKQDDFYTLEVTCSKEVHSLWCCDVKNPSLGQEHPPVPAPPTVYHPNLMVYGYLSKDSNPSCSSYIFKKDGQEISTDCFTM